ncbi:MAG: hypothetical protein ACD_48C00015G0001 [uncultured bacterium]|nr:MAG: hypothetical protein ACD_48C00015G0001 [uncultured bacterium]
MISTLASFDLLIYRGSVIVSMPVSLIRIDPSIKSDPAIDVSPSVVFPSTERLL